MKRDLRIFLLVLIVNFFIVLAYWIICHFRRGENKGSYRLRCVIMLSAPVLGILFFFFGWLYARVFFHRPVDLSNVIFSKDRVKIHLKADEEKEKNMVPLEEAIAVTEKSETRVLVMDIVRRDISQSLNTILLALNSDDSEVSHYAASILQDALGTFRDGAAKLYQDILEKEREIAGSDDPLNHEVFVTEERQNFDRSEAQKQGEGNDNSIRTSWKSPLLIRMEEEDSEDADNAEKNTETAGRDTNSKEDSLKKYGDYTGSEEKGKEAVLHDEQDIRTRTEKEAREQGLAARGSDRERKKQKSELLLQEMQEARELIENLDSVLGQKVFTGPEQAAYTDQMELLMELIDFRDIPGVTELSRTCRNQIEEKNFEYAERWCARLRLFYPDALDTYRCAMKLAYAEEDYERFKNIFEEMKHSDTRLDEEMIRMVRFFEK